MKYTLTSANDISELQGQPRHIQHRGVWFLDENGSVFEMEMPEWFDRNQPKELDKRSINSLKPFQKEKS